MSGEGDFGEHARDLVFERQLLLARLRGNLEREALQCAAELRREGLPLSAENLEFRLLQRVASGRPRSRIVPWHLPDSVVAAAIKRIASCALTEVSIG
jgi:hypothetical protein